MHVQALLVLSHVEWLSSYCVNSAVTIAKTANVSICLLMSAEPAEPVYTNVGFVMQQFAPKQQLRAHWSDGQSSGLMIGQQSEGQLSTVSLSEQMLSPQKKVWLTEAARFPLNEGSILRQHPRKQPLYLGQRPGIDFAYGWRISQ